MSSWRNTDNSTGRGRTQSLRGSRARGSWSRRGRGNSAAVTNLQRLENIASVSRSGGLEKDGDALKDPNTQEEYRQFIQDKLNSFWARSVHSSEQSDRQSREVQENILILFRKLREGIVSSKRNDSFSNEVYETSLYLATLFDNPRQLGSVLPYFIPHPVDSSSSEPFLLRPQSMYTTLIALINQLILGYPSQSAYRRSFYTMPNSVLPRSSESRSWISSVSSSLWSRNFHRFEKLTRQSYFLSYLNDTSLSTDLNRLSISDSSNNLTLNGDLARKALCHAVDVLRAKVRDSTWAVLRSSYRELACHANSGTRNWLVRSLALTVDHSENMSDTSPALDSWLEEKRLVGHVRPKEGVEGRWIICRVSS
ncbi:hypothetical protein GYMLUDRAFT_34114 [Collybiopsis luxurians FD-317 M1]|nr:hypothetical protein GYMLUDRAFT_34114 [Collybiopsis luxurians FD-317 M1]